MWSDPIYSALTPAKEPTCMPQANPMPKASGLLKCNAQIGTQLPDITLCSYPTIPRHNSKCFPLTPFPPSLSLQPKDWTGLHSPHLLHPTNSYPHFKTPFNCCPCPVSSQRKGSHQSFAGNRERQSRCHRRLSLPELCPTELGWGLTSKINGGAWHGGRCL